MWKSTFPISLEELEGQVTTSDGTGTSSTTSSWLPHPEVEGHLSFIIAPVLLPTLRLACLAHLRHLPDSCKQ